MSKEVPITGLSIRLRQERLYTILVAQEVAEGKKDIREEERSNLDRYARLHFGRAFDQMVEECIEMEGWHEQEEGEEE